MLVKAEAFLLFVIEGNKKLEELLPLKKAGLNVIVTDDMQPYRERKVRLLNGPHTTMTPLALLAGVDTVGDVMKDDDFSQFINDEMYDEISPMIALPKDELTMYIEAIKERFNNPFVRHELTSIALKSRQNSKTQVFATCTVQARFAPLSGANARCPICLRPTSSCRSSRRGSVDACALTPKHRPAPLF